MPRENDLAENVRSAMDSLEGLVRNLLVDNRNFKPGPDGARPRHFAETPRTSEFVGTTLASMAGAILGRIGQVRDLATAMAADADVPGLVREHRGRVHDHDVWVRPEGDGWRVGITVPNAFHDGDDMHADFPDERSALAAAREFSLTGDVPDGFATPSRSWPGA